MSACCLLSLIPDLKPKDPNGTSSLTVVSQPHRPLTSEESIVISLAIKILVLATSLSASSALTQCLPSVLHLLLSAIQYLSKQATQLPAASRAVAAGLQNLKQLVSALPLSDKEQDGGLLNILRSALASVLGVGAVEGGGEGTGLAATADSGDYSDMDMETQLLVMAVLILSPASGVCPPGSALFDGAVQLCKTCIHSEQPKVRNLRYVIRIIF